MFYNIIPVNQNTNFSTSSPLFFHLQSAVKFHNFAILGRRERGESVESNLRSERYEEIRKILIKIAQGFNQTDKTRHSKCSFQILKFHIGVFTILFLWQTLEF